VIRGPLTRVGEQTDEKSKHAGEIAGAQEAENLVKRGEKGARSSATTQRHYEVTRKGMIMADGWGGQRQRRMQGCVCERLQRTGVDQQRLQDGALWALSCALSPAPRRGSGRACATSVNPRKSESAGALLLGPLSAGAPYRGQPRAVADSGRCSPGRTENRADGGNTGREEGSDYEWEGEGEGDRDRRGGGRDETGDRRGGDGGRGCSSLQLQEQRHEGEAA
jgi:hypothetical protein